MLASMRLTWSCLQMRLCMPGRGVLPINRHGDTAGQQPSKAAAPASGLTQQPGTYTSLCPPSQPAHWEVTTSTGGNIPHTGCILCLQERQECDGCDLHIRTSAQASLYR
jgi:hypothetical protein